MSDCFETCKLSSFIKSVGADPTLVAGAGFEPATSGYEPDELPDCSTRTGSV